MSFSSFTYLAFLALAFGVNWALPARWRNAFLILASYLFYASWRWQFVPLLLGLSLFNWAWGRWALRRVRGGWALAVGLAVNLLPLLYFKYTNFLLANVAAGARLFGSDWHPSALAILVPLGISFFTFQGMAYLFDVAAGDEPLESLSDFLLFKALWPQLTAGPIVRLSELRDQIQGERRIAYDDVAWGCRRIVFGLFKKVVLADNLAPVVDRAFAAGSPHFLDAVVALFGFGLQIYFDFSAYTDIALGSARLLGFRLPENFDWPYRATSPQEFWGSWHMTLTRWIRDYLFTPLTFASRSVPALVPLWLIVAMAAVGLWHGAQWTFVLWGVWHGVLLLVNHTVGRRLFQDAPRRRRTVGVRLVALALTYLAVTLGWALFRAPTLAKAWDLVGALVAGRGGLAPALVGEKDVLLVLAVLGGFWLVQLGRWAVAHRPRLVGWWVGGAPRLAPALRLLVYAGLLYLVFVLNREPRDFVYFQF